MIGKALALFCMLYLHSTHAVMELDDNTFFNFAAKKQVLLVNFYAPWLVTVNLKMQYINCS